jgi:hypothetical protein
MGNKAEARPIPDRALDSDRKVSGNVMLKFQWNALRRGDRVLIHDSSEVDGLSQRGLGFSRKAG